MPKLARRLTDAIERNIAAPPKGYEIHWCGQTAGFGLRVTADNARAWVAQRRLDGQTIRRTLGRASGPGRITAETARRLQLDVGSELQQGTDRLEIRREQRKAEIVDALKFGDALREYARTKRRAKDGLPLKARTVADYLAMLDPAGATKSGRPTQAGELHDLADQPLHRITAADIRALHSALAGRGERRQTYAMQVLRAVLRHYGAVIDANPLSAATAGVQRVILAPSRGNPSPIPAGRLAAWWKAACAIDTTSADQLRFQLLTGCRPGEVAAIEVKDVDIADGRVLLNDTKNRADHTLMLSTQAREIAAWHVKGKRPHHLLFGVNDAGKTLDAINAAAGVEGISAHKLRHTFASIADDLVSAATARAMLNHAGGDVTQKHYIGKGAEQLRAGWQAVADFITAAAK